MNFLAPLKTLDSLVWDLHDKTAKEIEKETGISKEDLAEKANDYGFGIIGAAWLGCFAYWASPPTQIKWVGWHFVGSTAGSFGYVLFPFIKYTDRSENDAIAIEKNKVAKIAEYTRFPALIGGLAAFGYSIFDTAINPNEIIQNTISATASMGLALTASSFYLKDTNHKIKEKQPNKIAEFLKGLFHNEPAFQPIRADYHFDYYQPILI